ncbi:MAG: hypothetical protein ACOY93_03495 [Bacillota bacterium]
MQQPRTMWQTVFAPYLSYLALFLGMGLISGSIVHMPIDPIRYSLLMIIGAIMFGVASVINDMAAAANRTAGGMIRSVLGALLLSVGIGMVSGGIQHFTDIPEYAPTLIPLGLAVSLVAFIIKQQIRLSVKRIYAVGLLLLLITFPLKLSLEHAASNTTVEHGGGHGH